MGSSSSSFSSPDFHSLIESMPGLFLVLDLEFRVVAATDAHLTATMTKREDVIGRNVFDVFPDNPAEIKHDGSRDLRASLTYVRDRQLVDAMVPIKYDIRKPETGEFEERFWQVVNSPIFDKTSKEIRYILNSVEDVTNRMRAEKQNAARLQENNEMNMRLAAIVESSVDGIYCQDVDGLITTWNKGAEAIFGYTAGEAVGQPAAMLFAEGGAEEEAALLRRLRKREKITHIETKLRTKDNRVIEVSVSLCLLRNQDGEEAGISKIARDITADKLAAKESAILDTRSTTVLNTVLDGILVINDHGVISTFNRGAEKIFGYAANEMIGHNVRMLMSSSDASRYERYLQKSKGASGAGLNELEREGLAQHKSGNLVPVEISVTEMWVEGNRAFTCVVRDISERKAAQAVLAAKNEALAVEAKIDRIGAQVMVAINKHDEKNGPMVEVLRLLAEGAGYRPMAYYEYDEWQGGLLLKASLGMAPDVHKAKFVLGEGLVGEAAAQRSPVFIDRPNHSGFSLNTGVGVIEVATLFAIPMIHRDKLLGVVIGSSQMKLADRERSWLSQLTGQIATGLYAISQFKELKELSRQLDERSRRIEEQNRELAHASRLKSEFLANMSHELRTPLNAIIGFSELLKDDLVGVLLDDQRDYVVEIFQSGHHLLSLINDILDLSKIEAGKLEIDIESIEVAPLISNAITIMRERAIKGGVVVTHAIAPGIHEVKADGRKLRQIVYNLLSNAVKFTPRGGHVHIEVTRHDSEIEFAVTDSGIGISREDQARLFQPFEQVDGSIARKFEGTGLGLVMVKNLVELHNGTIGIVSDVGKGSRFWFRLPAQPPASQEVVPSKLFPHRIRSTAGVTPNTQPHLLVVDDDPAALVMVRRWLENEGYNVEEADTCDVAWNHLEKRRPAAILLDILFDNGPSGWEFLGRLRNEDNFANIPVVIISIVPDLEKGMAFGAVEVLQKPIAGAELLKAVNALGIVPNSSGNVPHVLVVDDDPRAVERIAKSLEQAGMGVSRAFGGRDALAAINDKQFSVVILDLMMPDVTGFDVVREIRSRPALAHLPVIILTAKSLDAAEIELLKSSVHTVLAKEDWNESRFLRVIHGALQSDAMLAGRANIEEVPLLAEYRAIGSNPDMGVHKHVLVVDDEKTSRDLLRLYFENEGYIVTSVPSAEAALAKLNEITPDLITLDLAMPGMDGYSFLAKYGQNEKLPKIPVLVISGIENLDQTLALGVNAALTKPVRRAEVVDVVKGILRTPGSRRPYILVVDDDPMTVKMVEAFFIEEAVEVGVVLGGREALESIKVRRPDLLILDLIMPDISGFEVLASLRSHAITADLPVVILSAKEITPAEVEELKGNVHAILSKATTSRNSLLSQVHTLLGTGANADKGGSAQ